MDTNFLLSLGLKTNRQLYEEWKINQEKSSESTVTTDEDSVTTAQTEDVEELVTVNNTPSIFSSEEWDILTGKNSQYTSETSKDSDGNEIEQRFFNGELIETVAYSEDENGAITEVHKDPNGNITAIITHNGEDYFIRYYNKSGAQTKSEKVVHNGQDGSYTKTVTQNGRTVRQEFSAKDSDGKYTMTEFEGDTKLSYHVYNDGDEETYAEYYDEDGTVSKTAETVYYTNDKVVTEKEPGKDGEEGRVTSVKTYDNSDKIKTKEIYTYNENGEAEIETILYTHAENADGSSYITATSDKSKNYKVLNYDVNGNLTVVYEYEYVSEKESTLLTATIYKNGKVTKVVDCVLEANKAEMQNLLKKYNAGAITLDEVEEKVNELGLEYTRNNSGITVELNENTYYSFEYSDVKASITSIISEYTNKNLSYEDALRNINRLYGNVEIKTQSLHSETIAYIFVDGIQFTSIYQRNEDIKNSDKVYDTNVYSIEDLKSFGFTEADIEKFFTNPIVRVSMSEEEIAAINAQLDAYAQEISKEGNKKTADKIAKIKEELKNNGKSDEEIASLADEIRERALNELMEEKRKEIIPDGYTKLAENPEGYVVKEGNKENNFEIYDLRDLIVNVVNKRTRTLESLQKEFNAGEKSYDDIKSELKNIVEYTENNKGITINYNGITFEFAAPEGYVFQTTETTETAEPTGTESDGAADGTDHDNKGQEETV